MDERLVEVRKEGIEALRNLSERLNNSNGESKLDCTGVSSLNQDEMTALFHHIRPQWRRRAELNSFINMDILFDNDNLYDNLLAQFTEYVCLNPHPPEASIDTGENRKNINHVKDLTKSIENLIQSIGYPKIISALVGLVIIGIGIKSWSYLTKPKISNSTITVGILTSPADYRELGDYLRKELVPANYFDYLQGKQVGIIIEGDKSLSYQEVKKRLADKKWDIAFARSPMISRFAQKQGYSYLAGMFPGSASYQSGIFVKANSPIRSINDIKPTTVVALGDFNSASSFYMPAYDLYGKTFLAKIARGDSPMSMVAQGKAEVGAAAIGDKIKSNNSAFRIIHTSRAIPGSGVYLSPQLAPEQQQIQRVLLAASKSIRSLKKANYGDVPEANYTEFDKITDRVDSIIECVDFDKNPVNLFCDKSANRPAK
jgi:ABC-type phosphate/phosphonate transport system substrate-binding protein